VTVKTDIEKKIEKVQHQKSGEGEQKTEDVSIMSVLIFYQKIGIKNN
jgi:hypothetical protein